MDVSLSKGGEKTKIAGPAQSLNLNTAMLETGRQNPTEPVRFSLRRNPSDPAASGNDPTNWMIAAPSPGQ